MACTGQTYTVLSGDSCYTIAAKFNVPFSTFYAANKQSCDNLLPGAQICLGSGAGATQCVAPAVEYTVKAGDTCDGIARAHGLTLADLYKTNPQIGLTDATCAVLTIGKSICV